MRNGNGAVFKGVQDLRKLQLLGALVVHARSRKQTNIRIDSPASKKVVNIVTEFMSRKKTKV